MQRLVFSTDDVPEAERFAYWREAVMQGICGVSGERHKDQETPFKARFVCSIGESLVQYHCSADGHPLFRRTRDIARRGDGKRIAIYRELGVVDWRVGNGREMLTRPGDLVVSDGTSPWASQARADFDSETWLFPRRLLDPHLPGSARVTSLVLTGRDGLAGIVKAYLDAFAGRIDALDEREADLVADNFCRLLAIACGAHAGEHQEAIRLARLEEAKRYVGLHLADPEMTPEKAAAALKISVKAIAPSVRAERGELRAISLAAPARGMPGGALKPGRRPLGRRHRAWLRLQQPLDFQPHLPAGLRSHPKRTARRGQIMTSPRFGH